MFWKVICLIVDVVIIDRPKESGYSEKAVLGYEGTSLSRRLFIFCNRSSYVGRGQ